MKDNSPTSLVKPKTTIIDETIIFNDNLTPAGPLDVAMIQNTVLPNPNYNPLSLTRRDE